MVDGLAVDLPGYFLNVRPDVAVSDRISDATLRAGMCVGFDGRIEKKGTWDSITSKYVLVWCSDDRVGCGHPRYRRQIAQ
jgi:hypothetical protein